MSGRSVQAVVAVVVLVCCFAAVAGAADSVQIVSASPMSGAFPISPASGSGTVAYVLESAPYAKIRIGPGGPMVAPGAMWYVHEEGTWVSKGTGQVTLHYTLTCGPETPTSPVGLLIASMYPAQTPNGPLPASTSVTHTLNVQGWLPCNTPPDITAPSRKGIVFGQKGVAWGSTGSLALTDSTGCTKGGCTFEAAYDVVNSGGSMTAPPFSSRLSLDTPFNVVSEASNLTLKKGMVKSVRTKLTLPAGTHTLFLVLDPANAVAEANENNNRFQVTYTLGKASGPLGHR